MSRLRLHQLKDIPKPKDDKFCGGHLQPEFFPITYSYCPYCGEELEIVPAVGRLSSKESNLR